MRAPSLSDTPSTDFGTVERFWNLLVELPCPVIETVAELLLFNEVVNTSKTLAFRAVVLLHNAIYWQEGAQLIVTSYPRVLDALLFTWERAEPSSDVRVVIAKAAESLGVASKAAGIATLKTLLELLRVINEDAALHPES
jgi:hypothetical protein